MNLLKRVFSKGFNLLILAVSGTAVCFSIFNLIELGKHLSRAEGLVAVDGTIVRVENNFNHIDDSSVPSATIAFSYVVDGRRYKSEQIAYGCSDKCKRSTIRGYLEKDGRTLKAGAPTKVWVDPAVPERAFMYKIDGINIARELGATCFVLFGALLFFVVTWGSFKSKSEPPASTGD